MIVTSFDDRLLVITQNDHAHFAGELLSLWRTDGLPEHPRRRELLLAAREHDNGWREVDSAPCRSSSGRPHDFMSVPRELRWEIWDRGTARFAEREPYAALLIVRHALRLHRAHREDADWADALARWRDLETELTKATGAVATDVESDDRWVDLTDQISLAVCNRWTDGIEAHGVRARLEATRAKGTLDETLTLEPFPLAGATTLRVACRLIPDRSYAGDMDLGVELATARWRTHAVRVAPKETRLGKAYN